MGTFYGDVLTNLFLVFGDVLTDSGTFWLGGVLTRGRFDLHPSIRYLVIPYRKLLEGLKLFPAKTSLLIIRGR